jgi:hypothetical protein
VHRRLERLDLGLEIWSCHDRQHYATRGSLLHVRRVTGDRPREQGRPDERAGTEMAEHHQDGSRDGNREGNRDDSSGSGHGETGEAGETESQRLTRNLNELLQELRVTQTGVQILTGFLLTVPFSQRFKSLDEVQRFSYLAILSGSVVATGLIIAPVAFHRMLFRHGERPWLVLAANRAARAGLVSLALTTSGVVWLVFDVVTDRAFASAAAVVSLLFFGTLWILVPRLAPRQERPGATR